MAKGGYQRAFIQRQNKRDRAGQFSAYQEAQKRPAAAQDARPAHQPPPITDGMITAEEASTPSSLERTSTSSSLGRLDTLPLNLLHSIFSTLDFQTLFSISKTCQRGTALVEALPFRDRWTQHVPKASRALGQTRKIRHHSSAAKPQKKTRVREQIWDKRARLASEESMRQRLEELVRDQAEQETHYVSAWEGYEGERIRAEESETDARVYLPVDEIDDSIMKPITRDPNFPSINQIWVITRASTTMRAGQQPHERAYSKEVAARFLVVVLGLTAADAEVQASADSTTHILLHTNRGMSKGGFKPTMKLSENFGFSRLQDAASTQDCCILLLIRGIDGLITDILNLRILYDWALGRGVTLYVCFYMNNVAGFSKIIPLSSILDDIFQDEDLVYLRRRWAAINRARQAPSNFTGDRAQQSEWMRDYAELGTRGRNQITNLALAD